MSARAIAPDDAVAASMGTCSSSTSSVIAIAKIPSASASTRRLSMSAGWDRRAPPATGRPASGLQLFQDLPVEHLELDAPVLRHVRGVGVRHQRLRLAV